MNNELRSLAVTLLLALSLAALCAPMSAQRPATRGKGNTVFGDLKVENEQLNGGAPQTYQIILYSNVSVVIQRQGITNGGRFRFLGVPNGEYYITVEIEGTEAARIRLRLDEPVETDVRQDIALEWRVKGAPKEVNSSAISAADLYNRRPDQQALFVKAQKAADNKDYEHAVALLQRLVTADAQDYQASCELGTYLFAQKRYGEAEAAYQRALAVRPIYTLALVDLGRLRIARKDYQGAIEVLTRAVMLPPPSAEINYLLGQCYLQIKKGSKAVGYLYEALRLEPIKMAEVHLRLALLYHGAGMKDKAAREYEEFLKKKPDYPDRKTLEQYIAENKRK